MLMAIKVVHTIVWTFFVACIVAIPIASCLGNQTAAGWFIGIVFLEVVVLLINRWHCPLTPMAARYTGDRRDNFDIYLPEWLARHNKLIFGVLYVAGIVFTVATWMLASG